MRCDCQKLIHRARKVGERLDFWIIGWIVLWSCMFTSVFWIARCKEMGKYLFENHAVQPVLVQAKHLPASLPALLVGIENGAALKVWVGPKRRSLIVCVRDSRSEDHRPSSAEEEWLGSIAGERGKYHSPRDEQVRQVGSLVIHCCSFSLRW